MKVNPVQKRRSDIVEILKKATAPVSGSRLAEMTDVSRQVIVQDIAVLRMSYPQIFPTARGYLWLEPGEMACHRTFKVSHPTERIGEELSLIVERGGTVENTLIDHPYYGKLVGTLGIQTHADIDRFLERMSASDAQPLLQTTGGVHEHDVSAETEAILDDIEKALEAHGFLV